MTLRDKIAERLRATPACLRTGGDPSSREVYGPWQDAADALADAFERGDFDDLLGVGEPTLEDVKREAVRAIGAAVHVERWRTSDHESRVIVRVWRSERDRQCNEMPMLDAPSASSAYAALRALPSKGET